MEYIILIVIGFFVIKYILQKRESDRKSKVHNQAEEEMTPNAYKFDFNPKSTITKKRIDRRYAELKEKIRNNETTKFNDPSELEKTYLELLRQAELRDKLMSELSGRRREFYD